ncbi:peptidoglycan DD-metalloendopeptidase family protein [Microbulbifer magnicolonia]|uniref:peptidoglycan DD-metalloendopeptidase family protein n=1 Tax=Microbulbifer magnicolonia TaxID=3109744 RepID=UPI002B409769|nr:peptidoglycan DD-metalloendopeptidase family protein [Microbulbifer sp. GG15]
MECRLVQHNWHPLWRDNCPVSGHYFSVVLKIFSAALLSLALASCASHPAPTSSLGQPPSIWLKHHTVSQGETLYSIAWRYGKDFRELASINGIVAPYQIYPGQRLQLAGRPIAAKPPAVVSKRDPAPKVTTLPKRKATAKSSKSSTVSGSRQPRPAASGSSIRWRWPAKGKVISRFSAGDPLRKGVDIAGEKGESVLAAADGTVIYAGSALRGYGKLLIVKHSEEYLSAYAHNHKLLVKEGSEVKAGQRIAELGSSGTDRNKLHFEIRRNGQPVDPLAHLP